MYLYILEAFNIPEMDLFSKSDPYLVVKIGDKVLNVFIDFNFSLKKNILRILITPYLTRKFIKLLNSLKIQFYKYKFGTGI